MLYLQGPWLRSLQSLRQPRLGPLPQLPQSLQLGPWLQSLQLDPWLRLPRQPRLGPLPRLPQSLQLDPWLRSLRQPRLDP